MSHEMEASGAAGRLAYSRRMAPLEEHCEIIWVLFFGLGLVLLGPIIYARLSRVMHS